MKAHISTNFEACMLIHAEGIAERFLAWFKTITDQEEEQYEFGPHTFEGSYIMSKAEDWEYRTFTVDDIWTFQIPNPEHYRPILSQSEITNTLILHVYPMPMQSLAEKLPKFFGALGIKEFELRVPRYERCVRDAVNYLLEGSKHVD